MAAPALLLTRPVAQPADSHPAERRCPDGHLWPAQDGHAGIAVFAAGDESKWAGWWIDCECGWSGTACSTENAAWTVHRAHTWEHLDD